jgi:hypothetical protein
MIDDSSTYDHSHVISFYWIEHHWGIKGEVSSLMLDHDVKEMMECICGDSIWVTLLIQLIA